jgi:hypothetical protein
MIELGFSFLAVLKNYFGEAKDVMYRLSSPGALLRI